MKGEMKPIMRFMWGGKQMRQTFFCGFELLGSGGVLLAMIIAMTVPIVTGLLGVNGNETVQKWSYLVAFVLGVMLLDFIIEIPYTIYAGVSGKGIRSIPYAKQIMTKGIFVNYIIFYCFTMVILLGMQGVGAALLACEASFLDEVIFFFGFFYLLQSLVYGISALFRRSVKKSSLNSWPVIIAVVLMKDVLGDWEYPVGAAIAAHVLCVVIGTVLLYPALCRLYKKRETTME